MISVKKIQEVRVDYGDVIRRSPVADVPKALELFRNRVHSTEHVFVGYIKGDIACIYGLHPPTILSNRAHIWLITTDTVEDNKFIFIRHSQLVIEFALKAYTDIYGETHVKDKGAFRWIRWLGGVYAKGPIGMFVPFHINQGSFEKRRWQTQ